MVLPQSQDGSFTNAVLQIVARRTGYRCSNPRCRKPTMGPHSIHPDSFEYVGKCAQICANQPGGERYDSKQTMEQRGDIANAIHLCCTCHTIVDHPGAAAKGYTTALMREWKQQAEAQAERALLLGENAERELQEAIKAIKLLTLQAGNLQQAINNVKTVNAVKAVEADEAVDTTDDEDTDQDEPF